MRQDDSKSPKIHANMGLKFKLELNFYTSDLNGH